MEERITVDEKRYPFFTGLSSRLWDRNDEVLRFPFRASKSEGWNL